MILPDLSHRENLGEDHRATSGGVRCSASRSAATRHRSPQSAQSQFHFDLAIEKGERPRLCFEQPEPQSRDLDQGR
jgi:hypothetical protein